MSQEWAERQRRTNRLVRALGSTVLTRSTVTPQQLYGLCKLTWITNSFDGKNPAYVKSTKIPALGDVGGRDYSGYTLVGVCADLKHLIGTDEAKELILRDTGFTNFYKAYRNSALAWVRTNFKVLLPMFRQALRIESDAEARELIRAISTLPGIPKHNHPEQLMRPEFLLTPVFFSLNHKVRLPLINGNKGVQQLLRRLGVQQAPLTEQFDRMVALFGQGGIVDAADLDQAGRDLPEFVDTVSTKATKQFLQNKPTSGNTLPLKDEADIRILQKARTLTLKRLHNQLTNKLKEILCTYTLLEGASKSALFDVLVKRFDEKCHDLLIEVKSSTDIAQVRMAIGQLYDYSHRISPSKQVHLAVLLPQKPEQEVCDLLNWLDIGLLWFNKESLLTRTQWLAPIAKLSN